MSRFTESPPRAKRARFEETPAADAAAAPQQPGDSLAELEVALDTYLGQQRQVQQLLDGDPGSAEVKQIAADIATAVRITRAKIEAKRLTAAATDAGTFTKGSFAEAQFDDGLWYTVKVLAVSDEPGGKAWRVQSVGYSNEFTVGLDRMRQWQPPRMLKKGDEVEAVNPSNGLFFSATIDMVTDKSTVWVTFKGKSRVSEELPLTHVRFSRRQQKRVRGAVDPRQAEEREQQERKRAKHQKWRDRLKEVDTELEAGRSSWKSFVGGQKPSKFGSRGGIVKSSSIFSSPATPDGRVGVGTCGSGGRAMTRDREFVPVAQQGRR